MSLLRRGTNLMVIMKRMKIEEISEKILENKTKKKVEYGIRAKLSASIPILFVSVLTTGVEQA